MCVVTQSGISDSSALFSCFWVGERVQLLTPDIVRVYLIVLGHIHQKMLSCDLLTQSRALDHVGLGEWGWGGEAVSGFGRGCLSPV